VVPDDLKALARPVLAHRLLVSAEAQLQGATSADLLDDILASVAIPTDTVT
jgi:MoxR-like ATPase